MNRVPSRRATVKASSLKIKLHHRFNFTSSVAAPDLLTWFEVIGYTVLLSPDIVFLQHRAERSSYTDVVLANRLHRSLQRINPTIPSEAIAAAIRQVTSTDSDLLENNRRFHKLLIDGVEVEYLFNDQTVRDKVWFIDPSNLLNNDWLAIHQFTVVESGHTHCPDVVVFINGLPLAVIVRIDPRNEKAAFKAGYQQIQIYKQQIPTLFDYNAFLVICCGNRARVGTLTSELREFLPWHTIDGEDFPLSGSTELEVLVQGIFDKRRFLDLVKHFIVFEETEASISKKLLRRPSCTIQNLKSPSKFRL